MSDLPQPVRALEAFLQDAFDQLEEGSHLLDDARLLIKAADLLLNCNVHGPEVRPASAVLMAADGTLGQLQDVLTNQIRAAMMPAEKILSA